MARKTLRIHYRTGGSGALGWRELDPYRVWYRSGGLYVLGHDHRSGEIRTFAVDRIRRVETTGRSFAVPEDFDFDAYTASSFGVVAEPASTVRIRFDARWRTQIEERSWHPSQKLELLPEGGIELHMEVGGAMELRNWVLSFGSGAEVLEPASLRAAVRSEIRAAATRYSGDEG